MRLDTKHHWPIDINETGTVPTQVAGIAIYLAAQTINNLPSAELVSSSSWACCCGAGPHCSRRRSANILSSPPILDSTSKIL